MHALQPRAFGSAAFLRRCNPSDAVRLIERLELAVVESPDAAAIESLHPEIRGKCRKLYEGGDYAEAVEKSFKVFREKLRALTGYETGSEAFW
jgi:hypothetical protein